MIAISRLRTDDATRAYAARKTAEGKSKREIIRCLKRYIAREVYPLLNPTDYPPALNADPGRHRRPPWRAHTSHRIRA